MKLRKLRIDSSFVISLSYQPKNGYSKILCSTKYFSVNLHMPSDIRLPDLPLEKLSATFRLGTRHTKRLLAEILGSFDEIGEIKGNCL